MNKHLKIASYLGLFFGIISMIPLVVGLVVLLSSGVPGVMSFHPWAQRLMSFMGMYPIFQLLAVVIGHFVYSKVQDENTYFKKLARNTFIYGYVGIIVGIVFVSSYHSIMCNTPGLICK